MENVYTIINDNGEVWRLDVPKDRLELLDILWSSLSDEQKSEFMRKELSDPFKVKLSGIMMKAQT